MAHSSSMDQPQTSGTEYVTVAEVRKLVHSEIKAEQRSTASTWIAAIAALALILGFIQWHVTGLRDDMWTGLETVRAEVQSVRNDMRDEIGSIRAEVSMLRGEISSLGERMARVEVLLVDRLPTAP